MSLRPSQKSEWLLTSEYNNFNHKKTVYTDVHSLHGETLYAWVCPLFLTSFLTHN